MKESWKMQWERDAIHSARLVLSNRSCILLFLLLIVGVASTRAQSPLFREASAATGLVFQHFNGASGSIYFPEIMGAGVALFDYDNDGDLDVYFMQGTALNQQPPLFPLPKTQPPGNRFFRNELVPSGKLRFTDVTEKSGLGLIRFGMGAATGDYDNDGFVDLYVTNFGSNALFHNNGNGTFTNVTRQANTDDSRWSTSAAFVDFDHDGDLDLFVCNYVDFTVANNKPCFAPSGARDYCGPQQYRGLPDRLFRNDGGGKFSDVTIASGIAAAYGPGLGVTCADFNGDGWLDIYVANDGAANLLWINQGNGKFVEEGLLAGAAYSMEGIPRAGMGVTAGDFDNDGDEDLLVTNLTKEGSTLYRNNGQGLFNDASLEFNLSQSSFLSTGFGVAWFDYDNDGWLDLFAANGAVTKMPSLRGQPFPFQQRNQLFHNEAGKTMREISAANSPALQLAEISRAAAFGDVDNDGDTDIVVANNNGLARLLLNENPTRNHWLQLKLIGKQDNRQAIGAKIIVQAKGHPPLHRRVHTDGSYLSANDPRVHFGFGKATVIESVIVTWPNGTRENFANVKLDALNVLEQGTGVRRK
jgi:enediyne biosynthesis protein E4